ncbi:sphingomyelin phosphodiesterase [Trichoderma cornu-damae]|uniref:Sphingomyelin phosphodiesterase n=1 Tax=Trichoderma cornu-damae TaxID=654480 RepID=A0A9P8QSA9_9HYPO|nr:sphingomyelin phosphodiesterase [Trichoderma cornu-damae]
MLLSSTLILLALGSAARGAVSLEEEESSLSPRYIEHIDRAIEARGLVDEIWDDIKNGATCTACQGILVLLKGLAAFGDGVFVDVAAGLCKLAKVEDSDVCDGTIALEGPIIANSLRDMDLGSATSQLFCASFLGLCAEPAVPQWKIPFPSPKPQTSRPAPSGKTPLRIVQYSDIHIDPLYESGSSANCSKPICCRPYTDADEPGSSTSPAGPNGDHKCDSPVSLEVSMYQAIKDIVPDAALALFTGDIVDHAVWNTSQPYNEKQITDAYTHMSQHLGLVYGTAGNHEANPTNAFPPKSISNSSQWVYDALSDEWTRWVGVAEESEIENIGAYSTKYPNGNLRIISLNTNFYYRMNFWLYRETMEQDPDGQIEWLVSELDAAERAGERVYIIGHMPLGEGDAFHAGSNYIDQVVNRYSSTIAAMFFGHTHVDHFEIGYSNYSSRDASHAVMTSYICPSLTPTSGMPSFRVYDVDPDTFGVLDATTYIADMTDAAFQTTGPVWTRYYSAKEAYGSKLSPPVTDPSAELTPAFWHNVTALFDSDSNVFNQYISFKSRGWDVAACTGDCKTQELCRLRAARSEDNCVVVSPGLHFNKKRSEGVREHAHTTHGHECGLSAGMKTLNSLAMRRDVLEELEARYNDLGAKGG